MIEKIQLLHLYSGKAPLKGEARARVRTSEGINPPSLGTTPDTHVLQTVNLGLTIVEEPGDHLSVNLGLTIVKEPVRGLGLILCPCVLSEHRLFPQVYLLLLVTLVTIILGFYPR